MKINNKNKNVNNNKISNNKNNKNRYKNEDILKLRRILYYWNIRYLKIICWNLLKLDWN